MADLEDIQWYSGHAGAGVRSTMLYGVTMVHRRESYGSQTLCGVHMPMGLGRKRIHNPGPHERRCSRCALIERTGGSWRAITETIAE